MPGELRTLFLTIAILLTGCSEKPYAVIDLPDSPDGKLRARAYVLEDSLSIKVSNGDNWDEFQPLIIGQCSDLHFYWSSPENAVVSYDKMQVLHFTSSRRYFSGASISLCDRNAGNCSPPTGVRVSLDGCDDATM